MPSAQGTGKATNSENANLWQSPEMSCFTASVFLQLLTIHVHTFSAYIEVLSDHDCSTMHVKSFSGWMYSNLLLTRLWIMFLFPQPSRVLDANPKKSSLWSPQTTVGHMGYTDRFQTTQVIYVVNVFQRFPTPSTRMPQQKSTVNALLKHGSSSMLSSHNWSHSLVSCITFGLEPLFSGCVPFISTLYSRLNMES